MDEEPEQISNKSRRSSILKMPKNRNPFGEVDMAETYAETTPLKTTRRVSFASSNLVKPFAADPDKNTIWDTTYEEEIHHTDSTQSSQEQSNKINSTFLNSLKSSSNITHASTMSMDITEAALLIDKENIPQFPKMSIVDYAKKLSASSFVPLFSLPSNSKPRFSTQMEMTCQNTNSFLKTNGAEAQDICEMELCEMSIDDHEEITNKSFYGLTEKSSEMNFTCQIPVSKAVAKSGQVSDNTLKIDESFRDDMEFTCLNGEASKPEKSVSMELTCNLGPANWENVTGKSATSMELTCQIPPTYSEKKYQDSSNLKKSLVDDMEFTCQLQPVSQTNELPKPELPNMIAKTDKSLVMSQLLTEPESDASKLIDCGMEFTCQIPSSNLGEIFDKMPKTDKSFVTCKLSAKRQNREAPKLEEIVDCTVEVSCQIPSSHVGKIFDGVSKTDKSISDMEFTCQIQSDRLENYVINPIELSKIDTMDSSYMSYTNEICTMNKTQTATHISNQHDYQIGTNPMEMPKMKPLTPPKILIKSPNQNMTGAYGMSDQSALDLTCKSPVNDLYESKSILYSQKIPNIEMFPSKHSFSHSKTPEPSFHINFTNISSSVDDTQHLLHCTYTKAVPECLIASRCETKEYICPPSKEIGEVAAPKLSNFSQYFNDAEIDDVRNSGGSQDFIKSKLTTANDTYVLAKKNELKNKTFQRDDESNVKNANIHVVDTEDLEDKDTSLGLLDENKLVLLDPPNGHEIEDKDWGLLDPDSMEDIPVEQKSIEPLLVERKKDLDLKKYRVEFRGLSEFSPMIERIAKQRKAIIEFLENFKLKKIELPEELGITEKPLSEESESSLEKTDENTEDVYPTLEEKIKEHQKRSQYWQLEAVDDNFYHFSTLFGTLAFIVELDLEDGRVKNITTENNLGSSDPRALYLMKLFLDKLDINQIKRAIGEHLDVLSLLDYVHITMEKLVGLEDDIMTCRRLTLTKEYVAKFKIISVPLTLLCEISLNVGDLENLNFEDVSIFTEKGVLNENEFKSFVESCPKGYSFFKGFNQCIDEYLKLKEKRRKFEKRNL